MHSQTARPPLHATLRLAACVLVFALAFSAGARAQDDDDDDGGDDGAAPIVVDINGPCVLTVKGEAIPCRGVAYMAFPSNHRIDFAAITDSAGVAFSGEDDANQDGRYSLDVDSVVAAAAGRIDADGACEMTLDDDKRTVTSLSCRASTDQGVMTLRASGVIAIDDNDDDDDGDGDG